MTRIVKYKEDMVSIITPAFRAGRFIGETIKSVQTQTYSNWEMIIVDDCSPDNTCEVIENAAVADSRIRLIRRSEGGGGPARVRNIALEAANGRWIAFLDSDDLWLPEKLSKQIEFHKKNGALISFTAFRRFSDQDRTVGRKIVVPSKLTYAAALGNTAIPTSTVLIDRAKSGNFFMTVTHCDDFVTWLKLIKLHEPAFGLNEDLMRYRVVQNSYSRNKAKYAMRVWKTYRQDLKMGMLLSMRFFSEYAIRAAFKYAKF
jgi:teichuronic acid biosynthesis glycosyltransferase TuaG